MITVLCNRLEVWSLLENYVITFAKYTLSIHKRAYNLIKFLNVKHVFNLVELSWHTQMAMCTNIQAYGSWWKGKFDCIIRLITNHPLRSTSYYAYGILTLVKHRMFWEEIQRFWNKGNEGCYDKLLIWQFIVLNSLLYHLNSLKNFRVIWFHILTVFLKYFFSQVDMEVLLYTLLDLYVDVLKEGMYFCVTFS